MSTTDKRTKEEIIIENDDDEWESMRNHWHRCVVDNNYEINDVYPFNIRRVGKTKNISEHIDDTKGGYVYVRMNDKQKRKHIIVAKQFIFNDDPEHKTEVDHVNGDKTDYHIENLRWTTHKENMRNRHSHKGIAYEFIDELPDDTEELIAYGNHELDGYYINTRCKEVYRQITENSYRKLELIITSKERYYCATSVENKYIHLFYKQLFG